MSALTAWLGPYTGDILLAYGLSTLLLLGLVGQSILAARSARRALREKDE